MSGSGGYLYFDKDSQCSDSKKSALQTAAWDATTLASYASSFPDAGEGNRGQQSGRFYMGPDFASQQNRISGNLKRAWQFKTDKTSEKEYITVSCKDTKNLCGQTINGKACPSFFTLDTLDKKLNDVEQELGSGSKRIATDMTWLRSTGQFFLHEMMHTRIASGDEPHIIDEYVVKIPDGERPGTNDVKAYGPRLVHNLAKRALDQGGGATELRQTRTAMQSWLIQSGEIRNCLWWDTTGYFPGVPGKANLSTVPDDFNDANFSVSLHIDLDKSTNPTTIDFTSLFNAELTGFGNGPPDPNNDVSAPSSVPATPPPSPPPPAADIYGDWHKVFFDHFEIYGKNFNADKFG
ncbi:MAG: hypothetical protein Q9163_006243 [Psora crenata]